MIDVVGEGLRAAAARSALAYPLVFAAGVVTGVGPCAAPRYVAVAALAHGARRPRTVTAAFAAGLVGAYVALGLGAGMVGTLWSASPAIYAALAIVLAAGGIVTLLRTSAAATHGCSRAARGLNRTADRTHGPKLSGPFLLGAASALVVSPCCTPVVAALATIAMGSGTTPSGAALLGAFACGHVVPVVAAGAVGTRLSNALGRWTASQAPSIVAGSLMLALAAYYGTLA